MLESRICPGGPRFKPGEAVEIKPVIFYQIQTDNNNIEQSQKIQDCGYLAIAAAVSCNLEQPCRQ